MILAQEQAEFDNFLEDFKSFVQMSAKRKLRDITLHNYAQHLRILIRNHGLPIENPDIDDEDEHDLARIGKLLIPFFAFIILALTIGGAWESLELNARAAVILLVMAVATFFYRKELSDIILD